MVFVLRFDISCLVVIFLCRFSGISWMIVGVVVLYFKGNIKDDILCVVIVVRVLWS